MERTKLRPHASVSSTVANGANMSPTARLPTLPNVCYCIEKISVFPVAAYLLKSHASLHFYWIFKNMFAVSLFVSKVLLKKTF